MSSHNLLDKELAAEIGPQLERLRLERQLSIEDLQAATHISAKQLRRMERGKYLTFSHLRCLLTFYGKKIHIVLI